MKHLNLSLFFLVSIVGYSCSADETLNRTQIETEVSNAFTGYVEHVNSKGLKGVESYFADDSR